MMSFKALTWAKKQKAGSAGAKLLLLTLADFANAETNCAWPSIATLVAFSELDRKAVISNLQGLQQRKLIVDSGQRRGETGQIKVWHLPLVRVPKRGPLKSPESGTAKESRKRNGSVFDGKSPETGTRNLRESPVTYVTAGKAGSSVKKASRTESDLPVRLCARCATPFPLTKRTRRYCSPDCRDAAAPAWVAKRRESSASPKPGLADLVGAVRGESKRTH